MHFLVLFIFIILVTEYLLAQSGMGCIRPSDEQLPGLIENFYSKDLGIELPLQSLYVCTSESQLSHTVMVEFTCEESEVCNGTALFDMDCFPGYGWNIRSVKMLNMFNGTIEEFVECTYCINDSMRIELFPSYPSNSYQYHPSSHCLCEFVHEASALVTIIASVDGMARTCITHAFSKPPNSSH